MYATASWPLSVRAGSRFAVTFNITLDQQANVEYGALINGRGSAKSGTLGPGRYTKTIYLTAPPTPGTAIVWAYVKVNGQYILNKRGPITVTGVTTVRPSIAIERAPSAVKPGDYVTVGISTKNISGSYSVKVELIDSSGRTVLWALDKLNGPVAWHEVSLGTVPKDVKPGTGMIVAALLVNGNVVAKATKPVTITVPTTAQPTLRLPTLASVSGPSRAQVGQPVEITAILDNPNQKNVSVRVEVWLNNTKLGGATVSLKPGRSAVKIPVKFGRAGTYTLRVRAYAYINNWVKVGEKVVTISVSQPVQVVFQPSKEEGGTKGLLVLGAALALAYAMSRR